MPTEHCSECEPDNSCGNDHLYVIELDAAAFPNHEAGAVRGHVYVGSTGKSVPERFADNFRRNDGSLVAQEVVDVFGEDGGWKYTSTNTKRIP